MQPQHLRVFLAVTEEMHFGRAAERLHMAQPPVTRIIQQLEKELGVALFDRSSRSIQLTAAGKALVEPAQQVIEAVEHARAAVAASQTGQVGRVTIGYYGASSRALVARLTNALRVEAPAIEVLLDNPSYPRLISRDFAQPLMSGLLRGEVDIAFGRWDIIPASLESRVLLREHLVMALPAQHRLAGRPSVTMADFATEPLVSTPQVAGSALFDRLLRLSYAAGFEPNIVQTAPDMGGALALVSAGLGCALAPSDAANSFSIPGVVFARVDDPAEPIHLSMVWHRDRHDPAVATVVSVATSLFNDADRDSTA